MKPLIGLLLVLFLLLQTVACRKETAEPVRAAREIAEPVEDTNEIAEPVADSTIIEPWPPSPGEVIIENLSWIFPWYNTLAVPHFDKQLPPGALFKVFIQRGDNPEWIEVPLIADDSADGIKYEYFIEKRPDGAGIYTFASLYIFYYGSDVGDKPSVKISY